LQELVFIIVVKVLLIKTKTFTAMTRNKAQSIKNWIKSMGFKLAKSHVSSRNKRRINYYTLDNFGVFEEITSPPKNIGETIMEKKQKFISWNPWGIDFEINSVRELSKAYAEFLKYNPDVVVS
jgi:hypothetical protein